MPLFCNRLGQPYRRLLLPVYLPSLLMALSQDALLVLLPLYVIEAGYAPAAAAFMVALRGAGVLAFDVPAGSLVRRFGEKPVLLLGLAATCAGLVLLALGEALWLIGTAAMLLGVGFAAWMLGRQSYIAATCVPRETGRAIAVMAGVQRGGAFLGPMLGGVVATTLGYPAAFILCALSALLAGFAVLRFAARPEAEGHESVGASGLWALIREHRQVLASTGMAALILQLMRATRQLLVPLYGASVGLDAATIGLIYSMSAAIDMCLFIPVGMVVDRYGRKFSAVPALGFFSLGLAWLPFTAGQWEFAAAAILLGFANGCGTGIVMILGADLARAARSRSQFLGVWRLMGDTGMSSAPLVTGVLTQLGGLALASCAVAGLGLIGTLLAALVMHETLTRAGAGTEPGQR